MTSVFELKVCARFAMSYLFFFSLSVTVLQSMFRILFDVLAYKERWSFERFRS
jgi:hypothetical protein